MIGKFRKTITNRLLWVCKTGKASCLLLTKLNTTLPFDPTFVFFSIYSTGIALNSTLK